MDATLDAIHVSFEHLAMDASWMLHMVFEHRRSSNGFQMDASHDTSLDATEVSSKHLTLFSKRMLHMFLFRWILPSFICTPKIDATNEFPCGCYHSSFQHLTMDPTHDVPLDASHCCLAVSQTLEGCAFRAIPRSTGTAQVAGLSCNTCHSIPLVLWLL